MDKDKLNDKEQQKRYYEIKSTGSWIEMTILVGGDNEKDDDGVEVKKPVIMVTGRNIGPAEIGCLYLCTKAMEKSLRDEYPAECLAAELSTKIEEKGTMIEIEKFED